jgi:hypothetical protein
MPGSKPGERRGGRKKGSPNKANQARQAKIAAEGVTPLDVMIDNMRHSHMAAEDAERVLAKATEAEFAGDGGFDLLKARVIQAVNLRKTAQEAARDAAPYVHPRLASVEHAGKDGGPIVVELVRFSPDADKTAV